MTAVVHHPSGVGAVGFGVVDALTFDALAFSVCVASPDADVFVVVEGVFEALLLDGAGCADQFGFADGGVVASFGVEQCG